MAIRDYNTSPASNTSLSGIALGENQMTMASINDAIRQMMADIRELQSNSTIASASTMNIGAANVGITVNAARTGQPTRVTPGLVSARTAVVGPPATKPVA